MAAKRVNVLFIGNPGTGKSTLLNSLIGDAQFKAGLSYDGSGVTSMLQEALHDGITYMDTPGLNDIEKRKQCAAEITKALKMTGLYYLCFVVTCQAGRIQPDDQATIRLVLESAPEIGGQYSIIVNKLEAPLHQHWTGPGKDLFPTKFFREFPKHLITTSIFYIKRDVSLESDTSKILPHQDMWALMDFLKRCPRIEIHPQQVNNIKEEAWQAMVGEFQKTIEKLEGQIKNNQEAFNKIIAEERIRQDEAQKRYEAKQAETEAAHRAEIQRMNAQIAQLAQRSHQGGCFPADSVCILENGENCKLSELQAGQKVFTVDDEGKLTVSEVYYVDGESGKSFHNYVHYQRPDKSTGCLMATDEHLIYASSEKASLKGTVQKKPIIAKNIKPGDFLFVLIDGQMERCQVTRTGRQYAEGVWFALTLDHRLLVDNVLVSSYEIDQDWGIADSTIMRGLYSISPTFVNSSTNKWFCKQYDQIFEPLAVGIRDFFLGSTQETESQ